MTTEAIRGALQSQGPFQITLADGKFIEVPHRQFAMLSRSGRILYVAVENEAVETIDVRLVTSLRQSGALPTQG